MEIVKRNRSFLFWNCETQGVFEIRWNWNENSNSNFTESKYQSHQTRPQSKQNDFELQRGGSRHGIVEFGVGMTWLGNIAGHRWLCMIPPNVSSGVGFSYYLMHPILRTHGLITVMPYTNPQKERSEE